jgi:hypothetical protein
MRSYVDRAKDFIEQVFPYIDPCQNPRDARQRILMFNANFNRKVIVSSGLSRIALITSDYVVKFDYDPEEVECIGGCENEIEIYAHATEEGFEYLFAKLTPYTYNNRTFYIMPRIYGIGRGQNYAEHYMTHEERNFCRKYRISDLHFNNYGFRNGHVCLVDYACHLSYESDYDDYRDEQTNPDSED